jgi:RES domain-containing protein
MAKPERGQWLQAVHFDPASGSLEPPALENGGRFNPPHTCAALYFSEDTAPARVQMMQFSGEDAPGRGQTVILVFRVCLGKVLDLCDPMARRAAGVTLGELLDREDRSIARSLGIASFREGYEGILYPRPLAPGERNLGIFRENISAGQLTVVDRLQSPQKVPERASNADNLRST